VVAFLAPTFGIIWVLAGVLYVAGVPFKGYASWAIWWAQVLVPGGVVIVLARCWGVPLRRYGLRWRSARALLLAFLFPFAIILLTNAVALVAGLGRLDLSGAAWWEQVLQQIAPDKPEEQVKSSAEVMAAGRGWASLWFLGFLGAVQGLTLGALAALGGELGWRGLLQDELSGLGFARSSLLIGLLWGLALAPGAVWGQACAGLPLTALVGWALMVVSLAVLLSWVRVRSGTVLTAAVMCGTNGGVAGFSFCFVADMSPGARTVVSSAVLVALALLAIRMPPRADRQDAVATQTEITGGMTNG